VTVIHAADAMNRGVSMEDVVDADSEEMSQLFEVFFDEDEYLQREFQNGACFNVGAEAALVALGGSCRRPG
jgi:hypothetical protein